MSNEIRYFNDGEQATASVLNRPTEDLDKKSQYMSKVDFENAAEMRRNAYAGSGFVDFGKSGRANVGAFNYINNDGLSTRTGFKTLVVPNLTGWGNDIPGKININGDIVRFGSVGSDYFASNGTIGYGSITFPEANTSVPIITDSTNMPEMKQGDMAILNDMSEKAKNGTFTNNVDDWRVNVTNRLDLSYDNNKLKAILHTPGAGIVQDGVFQVGVEYEVSFDVTNTGNSALKAQVSHIEGYKTLVDGTKMFYKGIYDGYPSGYFEIYIGNVNDGDTIYIDNISVKQVKATPIVALQDIQAGTEITNVQARNSISRQDLVFLETWHEDVSEKGLVYPYGNIQYRGADADGLSGIIDGDFPGFETYSLFGNWMKDEGKTLVGKGYVWSNLSNEDKLKFASNKDNNIYKDGDKIIQVRYRVRVAKGLGNEWANTTPWENASDYTNLLSYLSTTKSSVIGIKPKGKIVDIMNEYGGNSGGIYSLKGSSVADIGIYKAANYSGGWKDGTNYFEGNAFAMPIALVQRRNIGAYDPVHNPDGSAVFSDGKKWFESAASHNNIIDCFNNKGDSAIGTVSGRPDGLFSDEINERDVEDLRMSAHKRDYKELMDEYNSNAVSGKIRGKEKIFKSIPIKPISVSIVSNVTSRIYFMASGFLTNFFLRAGSDLLNSVGFKVRKVGTSNWIPINYSSVTRLKYNLDDDGLYSAVFDVYNSTTAFDSITSDDEIEISYGSFSASFDIRKTSGSVQNNTMTHTDIIGDPRKLSQRVKYTVVNGTSQTVDLLKNDYVLNDDGKYYRNLVERTVDLDVDDYTNITNWIDLGSNGNVGGYKDEWLENGIAGVPLIVGEEGESMLPVDRTNETYYGNGINIYTSDYNSYGVKVSKHLSQLVETLILKKDGTWFNCILSDMASDGHTAAGNGTAPKPPNKVMVNVSDASIALYGYSSQEDFYDNAIILITYKARANPMTIANNSKVLELGSVDAFNAYDMTDKLIGKVNTNLSGGDYQQHVNFLETAVNKGNMLSETNISATQKFVHPVIDKLQVDGPTVKYFTYLTESNSAAKLHYVFKEMKWDNALDEVNNTLDGTSSSVPIMKGELYLVQGGNLDGHVVQAKSTSATMDMTKLSIIDGNIWESYHNEISSQFHLWDGDGWGDDEQFQVINKVSLIDDDNFNKVIYGQKSFDLPYFID